ncbi:hypothetical protein NKI71_14730 [Mesorhizobium sp. M0510]|uniref:hypothetical protein n=1 Tax=Mesorhizobium sp. M0510 TaxID=2956954 RepID=UPI00333DC731
MEDYIGGMSRQLTIAEKLARNAEKQQQAYAALAKSLAAAYSAGRERAQAKIAELTAEYQSLAEVLRFEELESREIAAPRGRKPGKPLRELALDALEDLGVPAAPSLIADLTAALTGSRPSPSRFASLRRDDENAARRNIAARPAWIVPALNADQLTAIPRVLSSSAWSLERRIIGSRSMRTDHLRIALGLARRLAQLREAGAPEARNIERLLFPIARSIPGATETGQLVDPERVSDAARAELAVLEEADLAERREAAARLSSSSAQHRLWGRPILIDTAAAGRAIR